jgi:hypothetical protein
MDHPATSAEEGRLGGEDQTARPAGHVQAVLQLLPDPLEMGPRPEAVQLDDVPAAGDEIYGAVLRGEL